MRQDNPAHLRAFQLAVQHHQAGRFDEAEKACRQVLRNNPRHADALHLLGVIAWQAKRYDDAIERIEQALVINPKIAEAYYNLGNALRDKGEIDPAIAAYRQAIALKANFPSAHSNLGLLLAQKGQLDEAIAAQQQAIALRPVFPDAHYNLGNLLRDKARLDESVAALRQAIAQKPDFADAHYNLGNTLHEQGHLDESIMAFRHAIAINPAHREAHCNLCIVLLERGLLDQALTACQQAIAINPKHPNSHYNLGDTFKNMGRLDDAIAAYRQSIALDPDKGGPYRRLALVYELQGNIPEAIAAFKAAQERSPATDLSFYDLAALGAGQVPPASPQEYLVKLFNGYAGGFDHHLKQLNYKGPELLFEAVTAAAPPQPLDILDLGCGTGMCGTLFRPMARHLAGVYVAPRMIEKSRQRGVYDELSTQELTSALQERPGHFDLILAADVFIYVGCLDSVFEAAARALRPGGLLAFTIENLDSGDYVLLPSRRYAQSVDYIRRLASHCGFTPVSIQPAPLRTESYKPIDGRVIVLRAATAVAV